MKEKLLYGLCLVTLSMVVLVIYIMDAVLRGCMHVADWLDSAIDSLLQDDLDT